MNATDILVMPVASYFVNMYFLGCLRWELSLAFLSAYTNTHGQTISLSRFLIIPLKEDFKPVMILWVVPVLT